LSSLKTNKTCGGQWLTIVFIVHNP